MVPIVDFKGYTSRMEKGMLDKLWWLDMVPDTIEGVYDFGCADGALLSAVHLIRPDLDLSGYDNNEYMVKAAMKRVPMALVTSRPQDGFKNTVLVASSVFHEIHSYSENIERDYDNIFNCGADYIAIRDMFYDWNINPTSWHHDVVRVRRKEPAEKVGEFETIWGPLEVRKNLIHYLLKYRYNENWKREVRENYFANSFQGFISRLPDNYKIVYSEHYTLPYVAQRVLEDFDIGLSDKTHGKILLKRVG